MVAEGNVHALARCRHALPLCSMRASEIAFDDNRVGGGVFSPDVQPEIGNARNSAA